MFDPWAVHAAPLLDSKPIVEATILAAPSSTKNSSGERNAEMDQTRKGWQWYFSAEAHIGVDAKEGQVHSVCTLAATVSDVHMLPDLLHSEKKKVWGDGGYQGKTEVIRSVASGAQDMICRRTQYKDGVDEQARRKNRTMSRRDRALPLVWIPALLLSMSTSAQPADFDITPVAKGVYAVVGKHGAYGNGAIIIGSRDVVVVDTQLRPLWASEVISQIKQMTDKPVSYVINTHWHRDHVQGNQAYVDAFPNVVIIQHDLTRKDQIEHQPNEMLTRAPAEIQRLTGLLTPTRDFDGRTLNANERKDLLRQLELQRAYAAELPSVRVVTGTITFNKSMTLHEPDREIELEYFGYGHTRGDIIIYLPNEKVIVTGDLLEAGLPAMRTAYPVSLLKTLEAIRKLDWNCAIPGHGSVQRDKKALATLIDYDTALIEEVKADIAKGASENDIVNSVSLTQYSDLPGFDAEHKTAIKRTYLEIMGRLPD
jgi:cyclase